MGAHQVDLQFADLISGDVHITEFSNAGSDRVRNLVVRYQRVDHRARPIHRSPRIGIEQHGPPFKRNLVHCFYGEVVAIDVKSFQESFQFLISYCFPAARRNTPAYFSGRELTFISLSITIWVVSASASSVPSEARTSS